MRVQERGDLLVNRPGLDRRPSTTTWGGNPWGTGKVRGGSEVPASGVKKKWGEQLTNGDPPNRHNGLSTRAQQNGTNCPWVNEDARARKREGSSLGGGKGVWQHDRRGRNGGSFLWKGGGEKTRGLLGKLKKIVPTPPDSFNPLQTGENLLKKDRNQTQETCQTYYDRSTCNAG